LSFNIVRKLFTLLNKIILSFVKSEYNLSKYIKFCSKIEMLQKFPTFCTLQDHFYLRDQFYLNILKIFHDRWFFANKDYQYLEIGTHKFKSLLISKGRLNVGVDPQPATAIRFNDDNNKEFRLNITTSDNFFQIYSDSKKSYDFIFIDGLHTFEQSAKDLFNSLLRLSHNKTDILIHDIIPINKFIASTQRITDYWTGNVYKLVYFLQSIDVNFKIFLSPPSGLLWVKGDQVEHIKRFQGFPHEYQILVNNIKDNYDVNKYDISDHLMLLNDHIVDSQSPKYLSINYK
jgi:hypothetical protein